MRKIISFVATIGIIFTIASCGASNTSSSSSNSRGDSLEVKQARLEENLSYVKNGFQFCLTKFGSYHTLDTYGDYNALSYLDDRIEKINKLRWQDEKYSNQIVAYAFLKDECSAQDLEEVKNIFNQLPELIVKDSITNLYPYSDYSLAVTLHPYKVQDVLNNFSSIDENIESAEYHEGYTSHLTGNYIEPRIVFELKEKSHEKVQELARKLIQREDLFYDVKLEAMPEYFNPYFSEPFNYRAESNPDISKQTYLSDANVLNAWTNHTNLTTIKVGVIDSGIDATHEDLIGKVNNAMSKSFNDNTTSPIVDTYGHGTFVAGIIAANSNNNLGISGVAPNVELVSLKVNDSSHNTILDSMTEAITYAAANNIPILNISMGISENSDFDDSKLNNLKNAINSYPGLIVCAAGNNFLDIDLQTNYTYPACFDNDNIIVVGALQSNADIWSKQNNINAVSEGSNYGDINVDLFARGYNVLSTISSGISNVDKYGYCDGTSFAAPIVAGVAAMLKGKYPNISTSELKYSLLNNISTVSSLNYKCVTGGKVNANNTLAYTHFHSLTYTQQTNTHTESCACGYIKTEPHQLTYTYTNTDHTSLCSCGYTTTTSHTYNQYTYQDTTYHQSSCVCGKQGSLQKHTWVRSMAGNFDYDPIFSPYYIPYYECRQCGAICMDPTTGI